MAKWTVEARDRNGLPDPYRQPTFWSRRRADRYARKHTCEHQTVTVVPYFQCRCGNVSHGHYQFDVPPPVPVDEPVTIDSVHDFDG